MKNVLRILACVVAVVSLETINVAQTGYSISDKGNNFPPVEQRFYSFDINTGNAVEIGSLGNNIINYEGFASIGSVLYGFGEPANAFPSELRIFGPYRPQGLLVGATGVTAAQGNETALAYNPFDGFLYGITSNDNFPATGARSFLWRINPSTGVATPVGGGAAGTNNIIGAGAGSDANPYLDGLTILPNGVAYASECRFSGGRGALYSLNIRTRVATFRGNFAPAIAARQCDQTSIPNFFDTGLANNGYQLLVLLEDGRILSIISPNTGGALQLSTINIDGVPVPGDFEGFDIPTPVAR